MDRSTSKVCEMLTSSVFGKGGLVLLFVAYLFVPVMAQTDRDAVIKQLSKDVLQLITTNLENQPSNVLQTSIPTVDSLFNIINPAYELANNGPIYDQQVNKLKKDVGLDLRARYYYNSDHILEDGYVPSGELTRTRLRAGLDWSLLREGWQSNKNKIKRIHHQKTIDELENMLEKNDERLYFRYNLFIYFFNEAKLKLLLKRRKQLDKELDLLYKVYFLKGILYERIIDLKSRIEQINVQVANYQKYNEWIESTLNVAPLRDQFNVEEWPVLEVNLDYLIKDTGKSAILDSIDQINSEIEKLKNSSVNELSLRLQLDQNVTYSDDGLSDRSFASFGISLNVPTSVLFNKQAKDDLVLVKAGKRQQFNTYEHLNAQSELINYHYEYDYKLKTYVKFLYKEMLYKEKIRVETIDQENYLDIYRSLDMLKYIDVLREIQLETLDLQQQMYLLLLKIYGKTHYRSIREFTKQINIADFYERLPGTRTLVLDPSDWKQYDQYFIKNYLLSNDFEKIVIKTKNPMQKEIHALSKVLQDNGIEIVVVLDNPELLQASPNLAWNNIQQYMQIGGYSGAVIDLSVLPTSGGVVSEESIQRFIELQTLSGQQSDLANVFLGLQIDLDRYYPFRFDKVEHLQVKFPGKKRIRELESLLSRPDIDPQQLALSIRADEFKDRVELEGFVEQMVKSYRISNILIEGLTDFIDLDKNILVRKE